MMKILKEGRKGGNKIPEKTVGSETKGQERKEARKGKGKGRRKGTGKGKGKGRGKETRH